MNWISMITESLFGAVFELIFLGGVALAVIYRQRRALAQGKLEDVVLLSFNQIIQHQGSPLLAFRTPLVGSMNEIFFNESLVKEIKRAALETTDQDPVVRLKDPKSHTMMLRGLVNFSNQLNISGQVAALTHQPFVETQHRLALTYEPSARTKMFRILIVDQRLFEDLEAQRDQLTFSMPYHRDRLVTLDAVYAEFKADELRDPTARTLASFMVAAPVVR